MDSLIYMYPDRDSEEQFKETIKAMRTSFNKAVKFSFALFMIDAIFLGAYFMLSSYKHSIVLLLAAAAAYAIGTYSYKATMKRGGFHQLKITAYEDHMELTYYLARYTKKLNVYYDDILSARFNDSTQTGFQIIFAGVGDSYLKTYNKNDKEIENTVENLFVFKLNPQSWEQAFFLYIADDYFDIQGFDFTKKLERKYGATIEEYIKRLEQF